jgi:glycosyltransferase involved in cell wall biosynthesis
VGGWPLVSVIIPTFNEEKHLPFLLECLFTQGYSKLEVIVADNNSTDGTRTVCRDFNVPVVRGGLPGAGRNSGARYAKGRYLLFLDADTRVSKNFIASLLCRLQHLPLEAASCAFYPDSGGWALRWIHEVSNWYFWLTTRLGFPHCIGGCLIVRRGVHEAIGGFDESVRVAEDQDYVRRVARVARYGFLLRPAVSISTRRFVSEGAFSLCIKWIFIELHRLAIGEIRKEGVVRYF